MLRTEMGKEEQVRRWQHNCLHFEKNQTLNVPIREDFLSQLQFTSDWKAPTRAILQVGMWLMDEKQSWRHASQRILYIASNFY